MRVPSGVAHNHGSNKTYIAVSHIRNAPQTIKDAIAHRLEIKTISGCRYVALEEVFYLLNEELEAEWCNECK